ncbi:MAG: acetate/propionate family kinase [Clostridiales bacterium]|nr:acetate/propionate family kinase [Clostridiales bacterium]
MKILVCNAGSTSLKFKLYDMPKGTVLARAKLERVGSLDDALFEYVNEVSAKKVQAEKLSIPDYKTGIALFLQNLTDFAHGVLGAVGEIDRVGYKATVSKGHMDVHELTEDVLEGMREWLPIAPLHNRAYLDTIACMREQLPSSLFLGVFETSFHRQIPLCRRLYGVPYEWYENYGVQRLGYHSASNSYIASCLEKQRGAHYKAITCHLGGSSSVCAVVDGHSIDTSFGMSLQTGLLHANRTGDLDCEVAPYLKAIGVSDEEIDAGIHDKGGMLGISGISGDLRYVEEAAAQGNERAQLALDVFIDGIVRYIGSFYVEMGGLDTLVFTGGIGENSSVVRKGVCDKLGVLSVKLDSEKNDALRGEGIISDAASGVTVQVIPTDEEKGIAQLTYSFTH